MAEQNRSFEKMPGLRGHGGGHHRFSPHEKPRNAKGTVLRLLRLMRRWRGTVSIAVVLTLLSASVTITLPLLIGRAINTFDITTGTVDSVRLTTVLVVIAACYLTIWLTDTMSAVIMANVTQRLMGGIRGALFEKLQRIPQRFYDTRPNGDTMSRITNDVDNISMTVSHAATQLVLSVLTITGTFVIMLTLSPLMTCVAVIAVLLFLLLTRTISTRSRGYFIEQQRKLGTLNAITEETIVGLKMVKAFNRQKDTADQFVHINNELRTSATKAQTWAGFMMPFMNVINNLSFGLVATVGGLLSVSGALSIGLVVSFLTYARQFSMPLNSIAGMFANIQSALAGAERVFELMDEVQEQEDRPGVRQMTDVKGKVEFRDVTFSYVPGRPVLHHVSFTVNPGEVVALVGETGAGKTTIVNLLTRFYELDSGRVLIDDTDILDIARQSLRGLFSVVLQDTFLFTGTISDNIRYARPSSTGEEVRQAAILAHADEFITRLPLGYDTIVTGSTDNLSLGQRQLIAIARAILCNAPILILDEATSSVDTKTEKEIQGALLTLMQNHTSFLIAHRLSTIRDADRIMVIGGGEIIESGDHHALMAQKGAYYEMVMSQLGMGLGAG